jgi:hypothetical protein
MEADVAYYRRRLVEERAAASAAQDAKVRSVHLELAAAYEERSASLEAQNANPKLHLVTAA